MLLPRAPLQEAIFESSFEALNPRLWRVLIDLSGEGAGLKGGLGECFLEVHLPRDSVYPLEAPLPLLRNDSLMPSAWV
jgi:hypothetical protein